MVWHQNGFTTETHSIDENGEWVENGPAEWNHAEQGRAGLDRNSARLNQTSEQERAENPQLLAEVLFEKNGVEYSIPVHSPEGPIIDQTGAVVSDSVELSVSALGGLPYLSGRDTWLGIKASGEVIGYMNASEGEYIPRFEVLFENNQLRSEPIPVAEQRIPIGSDFGIEAEGSVEARTMSGGAETTGYEYFNVSGQVIRVVKERVDPQMIIAYDTERPGIIDPDSPHYITWALLESAAQIDSSFLWLQV